MHNRTVIAAGLLSALLIPFPAFADVAPAPPAAAQVAVPTDQAQQTNQAQQTIAALTKENALLQEKLKALESCSITSTELAARNTKQLKEIATDIRTQRQELAGFEGHVKWMSSHVAGYNKYLAAGSVAARFAKVLPIPYAGQASMFTKFVSDAAVSLGAASVSINKYLATSQQFLTRVDALDAAKGTNPQDVSALVRFADQDMLKGMLEVQERLTTTSHLTTSTLSFLESLNNYVGSTDEMWAKTKSMLSSDDKKEKSFLSESTTALRNKAQAFNGKFILFDGAVKKTTPQIKSLVAYDDLIREIDPKVAKLK